MIAGIGLALLTSASWALANVCIQKSGRALGAARAMFWAVLLGAALSGLGSAWLDERAAGGTPPGTVAWLLAGGASGLLAYVCLFRALALAPLSVAIPIMSSWSLVAGLISVVLFGERPGAAQLAGAAAVLLGVLVVSVASSRLGAREPDGSRAEAPAPGGGQAVPAPGIQGGARATLLASFGSALGFGIMVPAITRLAPALGEFGASSAVYAAGLVLGAPIVLARRIDLRPPARDAWALVAAIAVCETAGFVALAFARRFAPLAVVTPVASLAATLTVLYAWIVLGERPDRFTAAGAVLACAGLVAMSL